MMKLIARSGKPDLVFGTGPLAAGADGALEAGLATGLAAGDAAGLAAGLAATAGLAAGLAAAVGLAGSAAGLAGAVVGLAGAEPPQAARNTAITETSERSERRICGDLLQGTEHPGDSSRAYTCTV